MQGWPTERIRSLLPCCAYHWDVQVDKIDEGEYCQSKLELPYERVVLDAEEVTLRNYVFEHQNLEEDRSS